jgi:tetratricopeptide (TPR) repeat protein
MARALIELGKYKDSQRILNELIDKDPFSRKYWNALASAQFMNEDYSEAIQSSEYAIALEPDDPEGLLTKANGLLRLNNFEEALKYYQRYLELVPDDEFAMLHEGTCLINMMKLQEAIEVLKKAQAITTKDSSNFWDIYQELAFAYAENKEPDKALEVMDQAEALEYDPVQILLIRGHILLNAEKLSEARETFNKAIKISDSRKQTMLRVIMSFYDNRYVEGAYALLKRFLTHYEKEENGKNTEGYAYMALCCYELKIYDEFLSYLQKACEVNTQECRIAVGNLFPEDVKPEDYYQYIKEKLKEER